MIHREECYTAKHELSRVSVCPVVNCPVGKCPTPYESDGQRTYPLNYFS